MNILVFSDSHGDVDTMIAVARSESPDVMVHLGDHIADGIRLREAFAGTPTHLVRGNNDFEDGLDEVVLTIQGRRFLLAHGHRHFVEEHTEAIVQRARDVDARFALFGHTHQPHIGYERGVWLLNPGRSGVRSIRFQHATYGVIRLRGEKTECAIREA